MQLSPTATSLPARRSAVARPGVEPLDAPARTFRVEWARTSEGIAEAQRLRFRVFVGEMGARLRVPANAPAGHDVDRFDSFCEHLLVRADGGARHGEVIATCRVLTPAGARRAGRTYTAQEFDLAPISGLLPHALEMGRVCVHPAWRNGLVVMALWRALGGQMVAHGLDTLIGCCRRTQ